MTASKPRPRALPAFACFNAMIALAFGTFAAHGIRDPQARDWIMTGVMFQLPHVAAVFGLIAWRNSSLVHSGAWAVSIGSFIFAMDLNLLALGAPRWVAALAPAGGTAMLFGWAWLALIAFAGDALQRFED
ncbi:DUF423 domain-containing protein [Sandarakinorhabdus rubra]|uniref:DUF423 domain-containing protein n=1 Tax=Sandarakinorhabdus rubra TaxID=2672568 RepID=UPI001F39C6F8|nr:DUF423 domain-containing protein [Sandarakinorhabdus rubra]